MKSLATHIELVRSLERRPRSIYRERPLVSILVGGVFGIALIGGGLFILDRLGLR